MARPGRQPVRQGSLRQSAHTSRPGASGQLAGAAVPRVRTHLATRRLRTTIRGSAGAPTAAAFTPRVRLDAGPVWDLSVLIAGPIDARRLVPSTRLPGSHTWGRIRDR